MSLLTTLNTTFAPIGPLAVPERWTVRQGTVQITTEAVTDTNQGIVLREGQFIDLPAGVTVNARTLLQNAVLNREANLLVASPNTTVLPATPTSHTLTAAATTNATVVKASAGQSYSLSLSNYSALIRFFKIYNKATAPVVGTDIPIMTIPVLANSFLQYAFGTLGQRFTAGISYAMTGLQADTDTTVLAAGDMKVTMSYL